ncbi:MAG: HesA/MoeB/ThiF family protein [Acidobacteriota bacterium]
MMDERLSDLEKQIYRRNVLLPGVGEAGQLRLKRSRVLVVGAGGLGSPALYYLAASGVGEIGIVDGDRVDLSNLQRQILHGREDIGRLKTDSARDAILHVRPDVRLNVHSLRLTEENGAEIIAPYDFVVEATDNFESKFLINDLCVRLGKPFSHAGIIGFYGQAMTVVPGQGPCYRCVFEDVPPEGEVESPDEAGVLGSVPGVMGSIQAMEAIKYLLDLGGLLTGRLLTWNGASMAFREIKLSPNERCRACGGRAQDGPNR